MAEDIAGIVGSALGSINEARGLDAPDLGDSSDVGDAEVGDSGEGDTSDSGSTADPVKADAKTPDAPTADEIDVFLQKHGLHQKPDGSWSALPRKRARKMLENYKKQAEGRTEAAVKEYKDKLTAQEKRVLGLGLTEDGLDRLIASDPDKYLRSLAALHPDKYSRFLVEHPKVAEKVEAAKADDMPGPDIKDKDGNLSGYSLGQFEKRLAWLQTKASEDAYQRAMNDSEQKFGPILKEHQAREFIKTVEPDVRKKWDDAAALWGEPFLNDANKGEKSEVLALMKTGMSFETAVQQVMVPLMRADRSRMRTEIQTELGSRSGAASTTTAGSSKSSGGDGPVTVESIVGSVLGRMKR